MYIDEHFVKTFEVVFVKKNSNDSSIINHKKEF